MHMIVATASIDHGLVDCVSVADANNGNLFDHLRMELVYTSSERVVIRAERNVMSEKKAQFG